MVFPASSAEACKGFFKKLNDKLKFISLGNNYRVKTGQSHTPDDDLELTF